MYIAIYGAGGSVAGFSLSDAISYSWVTQSLISIGAGWIIARELMQSIRTGDVVTDLARPWNFYGYWLSQSLGECGFNLLLRGSITYLIGALYFRAHIPTPLFSISQKALRFTMKLKANDSTSASVTETAKLSACPSVGICARKYSAPIR